MAKTSSGTIRHWSRIALTGLIGVSMVSGLTACDENDVATALGAAAIVAGAVAIGASGNGSGYSGGYRCEGGYRRVCSDYRDFNGFFRTDCGTEWDSCAHRRWVGYQVNNHSEFLQTYNEEDVKPYAWAKTFDMGLANSGKLIHALEEARNGNAKPAKELGFKGDDAKAIANHELPEEKSIRRIASKLDSDVETTRRMLQTLIDNAPEE